MEPDDKQTSRPMTVPRSTTSCCAGRLSNSSVRIFSYETKADAVIKQRCTASELRVPAEAETIRLALGPTHPTGGSFPEGKAAQRRYSNDGSEVTSVWYRMNSTKLQRWRVF